MPKTFKSNLGLEQFDDLETIKNNPDFFIDRLAKKFTTKVDNYTDYDDDGNEYTVYNFHLELKKANGRHIYVRVGTKGAKLENKVNIHTYTDESGKIYRRDSNGNILHPLFSINDEVYLDENGNEIIVTSPDTTTWKTLNGDKIAIISNDDGTFTTIDGHEVTHIEGNKYYDTVAGIEIEKIETSGI
jgi:bifunctional DNA-binding transcriptional regulator/antitoxin component of YhaV-PrlF toxin-antitoxin module